MIMTSLKVSWLHMARKYQITRQRPWYDMSLNAKHMNKIRVVLILQIQDRKPHPYIADPLWMTRRCSFSSFLYEIAFRLRTNMLGVYWCHGNISQGMFYQGFWKITRKGQKKNIKTIFFGFKKNVTQITRKTHRPVFSRESQMAA